MDIKDCIIYEKTIPAHPAVYDDFPENLLPELAGVPESRTESGSYTVIRRKCLRK